jgi:Icc-related predicted phosphoesterase
MTEVVEKKIFIEEMTNQSIDKIRHMESFMLKMPQVSMKTDHVLMTGVVVKIQTVLIVSGKCKIFNGVGTVDFEGYNVIPANAPRKMTLLAIEETKLTMIFPTDAKTEKEAEEMFTDEYSLLVTRKDKNTDVALITGELK